MSAGAVVNVIINYFLIPVLGIEGASLATLMGYVVSDIVCVIVLCRMRLMVISKRFIVIAIVMTGFMMLWRLLFSDRVIIGTLAALGFTVVMLLLCKSDLLKLWHMIKDKKSKAE